MKVLALHPPDTTSQDVAEYSFLSEEFRRLSSRGIKIHTIAYSGTTRRPYAVDGVTVHPMPRQRHRLTKVVPNVQRALGLLTYVPLRMYARVRRCYEISTIEGFAIEVARANGADLIHASFGYPDGSAGVLVKNATGLPLLLSVRGADILTERTVGYGARLDDMYDMLFRRALQCADVVTANSGYVLERILELGVDRRKCILLPRAVDTETFSPAECGNRCAAEATSRPTILAVRHATPKNGLEYLIHAARLVANRVPSVVFMVCGHGGNSYERQLKTLVRNLELEQHVVFAGWIPCDRIASYFRSCDVSVIPSVMEAAGNVILEAMACGKPVIGSRVGGIPEYIDDGVTGFLVEPRNPAVLADRILTLIGDKNLARQMGMAGRARVVREFQYDAMIARTVGIYEELVRRPAAS